jgi:DNA-binding phage protein
MPAATRPITDSNSEARGEWEEFRDELLRDPEARAEYARSYRYALFLRRLLQQLEAERVRAGLSKTELAHRVGVNPSAMRRLLTAETANPTLKTMLGVFDALGLEVSLTPSKSGATGDAPAATSAAERETALAS